MVYNKRYTIKYIFIYIFIYSNILTYFHVRKVNFSLVQT